jgi:hypothetical protein
VPLFSVASLFYQTIEKKPFLHSPGTGGIFAAILQRHRKNAAQAMITNMMAMIISISRQNFLAGFRWRGGSGKPS